MKKLIYISSIAAPHQVKLCYALQKHYKAEFWFYDNVGSRAKWWNIDLGDKCKVLSDVKFKSIGKFYTQDHISLLEEYNPDIVMLGGFSIPANYIAYRWAKKNNKKKVIFTERSRDKQGNLRKRGIVWTLLKYLYSDIDLIMVSEEDIVPQFRDEFRFGDKVVPSRYAADIEAYLNHKPRKSKSAYTYMFPNRLTEIYNPMGALEIFLDIYNKHPESKLIMNALGEQREDCNSFVAEHNLSKNVTFLDNIESWDKLHLEYEKCDILLFPATFSNGNFTIIEAMASGMGIIISNKILGVGNYIENGVNGFRIDPDKQSFLQAVQQFIDNPDLFNKFGDENEKRIGHLGAKGTAKLYDDIISKLF